MAARDWLQSRADARLLHVFDSLINLMSRDGSVLSVVSSLEDLGPFAILTAADGVRSFRDVVSGEATVRTGKGELSIGSLVVDWRGMDGWEASPLWEVLRERKNQIRPILPLLREEADRCRQARRESSFPADISRECLALNQKKDFEIGVVQLIREGAGKRRTILQQFLGCGQGLTPSGDDYLLGALLAGWIFMPETDRRSLSMMILAELPGRTTQLSAAWLRAAARGECGYLWHQLFDTVLAGKEADIRQAARAIAEKGYSSGTEALSGFCAAAALPGRPRSVKNQPK